MIVNPNELASFGSLLKAFRKRQHLTQQQLALAIGMHRHAVGRWEQGDFLPATRGMVLELARHLALDESETRQLLEASLTALSPHWLVPFPRNPFFTGREEILAALHTQLGADQTVALTQSSALHGLGGVGKTQIALEYVYRNALDYNAVFWVRAETSESILSSLLRIAEVLQLPERDDTDQQRVIASVQRWLATHSQWLLIWDNVEDLELLEHFLPATRAGATLLTTRNQASGTLARGIDLLPMEREEGMLFLLRRAKVLDADAMNEQARQLAVSRPGEYAVAEELAIALGGLPLALDQAGAYIEETGCGISGYLQQYTWQRACLLDRRGSLGRDHPQSVTATFRLAMERVEREQHAAADVLRVCALLYAEAIPEEVFGKGAERLGPKLARLAADSFQFDQAIAVLQSLSLVQRSPETHTLSLHRLVQAVILDMMTEAEQQQWTQRAIEALDTVFPEMLPETEPELVVWQQCEQLLPHALPYLQRARAAAESLAFASLAYKTAEYLCQRGLYEQAESFYQRALSIWEQALGLDHPQVAYPLFSLAMLYVGQGKYERAELLYQRALSIREQALGLDHPQVAYILHASATLYREQGKYEQAEPLFRHALQIQSRLLGSEHPRTAYSLNGLAILYKEQSKYKQAESLYQRALSIWEQALGPKHPNVARAFHNLADLYQEQNEYEQAESLYQRALSTWEQALGPKHPRIAYPLGGLAELKVKQGKYEQAEPLYQRVLQIQEQALGPDHIMVGATLNGLATLYREQGKYEQAEPLFVRALAIQEQQLGARHPEMTQTLHDLAILRQKQGNLNGAISLAERALQIRLQSFGDTHPKLVATQMLYAQLLQQQAATPQTASERYVEGLPETRSAGRRTGKASLLLPREVDRFSPANDPLQGFLDAYCELHPRAWCRSADLWQAYERWVEEYQERYPLSRRAFTTQLEVHGCCADRTKTARIWRGIAIAHKKAR